MLIAIADGVSGSGPGGDASRMAVKIAQRVFLDSKPDAAPVDLMPEIFITSNQSLDDAGMENRVLGRGATTLTAAICRRALAWAMALIPSH